MQPQKTTRWRSVEDCKRHIRTRAAALLLGGLAATSLGAAPLETYYVPIPEGDIQEALAELNPNNTSSNIESVVSIALGFGGTIVRYDHQEDGYEADLENPLQATTEIWGDGNPANGAAPGFPGDVFSPGDVLILKNTVPTAPRGNAVLFDAADMFTVTQPVAVTRVAWAPTPGTVLAGAVEVFPTSQWGTMFEAPLGEDFDSSEMFELVTSSIMAAEDGTVVDFDFDANGTTDLSVNLDQGETFFSPLADGFPLGNRASSNKPIQVHAITGDIGARWESRWAVVLPLDQWSDEYSLPVSTRESSSADPTDVFLYNPDPDNAITVSWETTAGAQTDVNVPARDMARVRIPDGPGANDTGARFFTADNSVFYAVAVIDANDPNSDSNNSNLNNRDYDWGIALLPNKLLSTQALVGFAPGIDPNACSAGAPFDCSTNSNSGGSPVWVMATGPTTVFVDFDADPTTGALVDGFGNQYDMSVTLGSLERAKIFDPNDNDMTGALLYTLDGSLLALAWGQDPASSVRTNPYFDAGTIIPGLTTFTLTKDVNKDEVARGEALEYTLVVTNTSRAVIPDIVLEDVLPPHVEYVPDTSSLDGNPFADDGVTPFPLDEGGASLGSLDPGEFFTFVFQVTVNEDTPVNDDEPDDCADPQTRLLNTGMATAIGVTREDDALTCVVFNPEIELLKQVSLSGGEPFFDADNADDADVPVGLLGADATYRLIVRNTGDIVLENLTVTDAQLGLNDAPVPGGPLAPGDERVLGVGEFNELFFENRCDDSGNKLNTATVEADVPNSDMTVGDSDTANVRCVDPGIELLKQVSLTGGAPFFDADTSDAADVPEGPLGSAATYRLIVRNIGSEDLTDVRVSDATLGLVNVLVGDLAVGAEVIIDAGDAGFGNLEQPNRCDTPGDKLNTALASATGADSGEEINDEDDAYVRCLPMPGIELLKQVSLTGGAPFFDADNPGDADVPAGLVGADATYRLIVRNTGEEDLTDLVINDATLGLFDVPIGDLAAGDEIIIDSGMAGFGGLEQPDRCDTPGDKPNIASVNGVGTFTNDEVGDTDPAWVRCLPDPEIELLKQVSLTGGAPFFDADSANAPDVPEGSLGADATYRLIVRNTGTEGLTNVTITDATLGLFNVPVGDLVAGAEVILDAGSAGFGNLQQADRCDTPGDKLNTALVEATGATSGGSASDDDPAWVRCVSNPEIDIEKQVSLDGVNYFDADSAGTAVEGSIGDDAFYRLIVSNIGDEPLDNLLVTDATLGLNNVPVPGGVLQPGEQRVIDQGSQGFSALFFPDRCDSAGIKFNEASVSGDGAISDVEVGDSNTAYVNCERIAFCAIKVDKKCTPIDDDDDGNGGDDDDDGNGGDDDDDGNGGDDDDDGNGGDDDDDGNGGGDDDDDGNGGDDDDDGNGGDDDDDGNGGDDDDDGNGGGDDDDDGNGGDSDDKDRNSRSIDSALRLDDDDDDGNGGDDDDDGNGGDDDDDGNGGDDDDDGNGGDDDDDGNGGDDDDDGNGGDDDDDGNGGDDDDDGNGGDDDDDGNGGDDDDDGGHQPPEPRDACTVDAGDRVRYDYSITNTGDTNVSLTSVFDDILLEQLDPTPQLLPVGETLVLSTTATLHETTINTVTVDGHVDGDEGATCGDSDSVTVTVEPPHDDDDDGNGGDDDDDGNGGDDDDDGNGGDDDDDGNGGDDDDDGNGGDDDDDGNGGDDDDDGNGGDDDDDGNGGDDDDDGNGGGDDDDDGNGGDDDDDGNGNGDMYGKPSMNFDKAKEVHWELTNNGAEALHIVNIEVHWPAGHGQLKKMKLNGDFVRRVNDAGSPTLLPQEKSMMSGLWRRTIGAGQTASLVIKFSQPMTDRSEADYQITIEFSNGEILSY